MTNDDEHRDEVDRLWRSFHRELSSLLESARLRKRKKPARRLFQTWERLCESDPGAASRVWEVMQGISGKLARFDEPNSPAEHRGRIHDEVIGLMQIGRAANPDAGGQTADELIKLGEQAIRDEIDKETGGPESAEAE